MEEMEKRENAVRLWFDMWLRREDLGIRELFAEDAVYVESWGPEYHGVEKIAHWFLEWNTRGTVLRWDIKQFFHRGDETAVEWFFQYRMEETAAAAFDGMTLIRWTKEGKIAFLKEFGCNICTYDPYQDGPVPKFRDESAPWL